MGRVVVVGSLNEDAVMYVRRFPAVGETVLAARGFRGGGGKGGNQALAASAAGASVALIAAVGEDAAGMMLRRELADRGIDVQHVAVCKDSRSGFAAVLVEEDGENRIVVDRGSNQHLSSVDVRAALEALAVGQGDVVLASMEISADAVAAAARYANRVSARCVINASPVSALEKRLFDEHPWLILNKGEAARATGSPSPAEAASVLAQRTGGEVFVTLGGAGVLMSTHGRIDHVAPHRVNVVDTVGAGDVFAGAFSAALAAGAETRLAVERAQAAGADAVQWLGAHGPWSGTER